MIDTKAIKDRILSYAYQGKLIEPNRLSNENIKIIHAHIKGYVPVSEEEYLIDVPEEWNWTRLGYVTSNHGQVTPSDTFSYIDVGTLDNVNHRLSASENIVEAKNAPSRAKKVVETGDVIYSTVRPYLHNICIIDKDFSYTPIASTAFCVMHANEEVLDNKYLFYWLLTKEFDKYSNGDPSKGALYPAIGEKDLLKGVIPLPSVIEQKVIVEKIEAVFEILDKIDALQNQYAFNQEALKSKLIDAAIQGKLTEQLPEDGTAEELFLHIQEVKNDLIKSKRFKKDKSNLEVNEEDIPFDIPESWKWVCWGEIVNIVSARRVHQSDWRKEGIPFYRAREIAKLADDGFVDNDLYISEELYDEFSKSGVPSDGDLMVSAVGTLGKTYVVKESDHFYYKDASVLCFENYADVDPYYLKYVMNSGMMKKQIDSNSGGTTVDTLTMVRMIKYLLPLPPLAEQHRIVEELDAVLSLIE